MGIARIAWLMLTWRPLMRWMLAAGALFAASGATLVLTGVSHSVGVRLLVLVGTAIGLIPVTITGGMMFRAASDARAIGLAPQGELRVLAGMFTTLVAMALAAALAWSLVLGAGPGPGFAVPGHRIAAVVFVDALGAMTAFFLASYSLTRPRIPVLAILGPLLAVGLILGIEPDPHFPRPDSPNSEVFTLLAATVLAWLGFGTWFLGRSRLRTRAHGTNTIPWLLSRWVRVTGVRPQSLRIVLAGPLDARMTAALTFAACLALFAFIEIVTWLGGTSRHHGGAILFFLVVPYMAVAAGSATGALPGRARSLWLLGGLDRLGLFHLAEASAWRQFAASAGAALLACVLVDEFLLHSHGTEIPLLVIAGFAGVSMFYFQLFRTKGWPVGDIAVSALVCALWSGGIGLAQESARSPQLLPWLAPILLLDAALVLLLRWRARRRWQVIDWRVCKRPPTWKGWTGSS